MLETLDPTGAWGGKPQPANRLLQEDAETQMKPEPMAVREEIGNRNPGITTPRPSIIQP